LREKPGFARAPGGVFENLDERAANDFTFPLRIGNSFEPTQKKSRRIFILQLDLKMLNEDLTYHLGLPPAQNTVVDENTGELIADCLVQQRRGDAGIDAAA